MLAHREEAPAREPQGTLLCVHGFPESSYMWRGLLPAAAQAGWRAVAPDLTGYGDSPPGDATWAGQVAALDELHRALDVGPCVLVLHDWGGLIGLRWAYDRPELVRGLVLSNTGFFPDGKWHGLAEAVRTPVRGEEIVDTMTREGFDGMLRAVTPRFTDDALDEYWKCFATPAHRRGVLDLYRSGEFAELEGTTLARFDVPALLLWGEQDIFAPITGAHRFERELPQARLEVFPDAGHFVFDEEPEAAVASVLRFLGELELLVP